MASSSSPCAACKFLRRKCTQECVFAPYFPPDQPLKFANVHKVFGASNVAKILNELPTAHREDAVNSLAYEAEARLRDPVYGCVGYISMLQQRLKQIQTDLHSAKLELATYMGPATQSGMMPILNHPGVMGQYSNMQPSLGQIGQVGQVMPSNMQAMLGIQGPGSSREVPHHQQLYEVQQHQLVEAAREQEMIRNLEQQQQRQQIQHQVQQLQQQAGVDLMRFNRGFDVTGPSDGVGPSGQANPSGNRFTHLTGPTTAMSPSLALGGSYDNNMYHIQQRQALHEHNQHQLHHHLQQLMPHGLLVHQQPPQPQQPQQPQQQPHHGDHRDEGPSS